MDVPTTPPGLRPLVPGTDGADAALTSRRLARHLAWAVPVLAVATASPAVAVSTPTVGGLASYRSQCSTSGTGDTRRTTRTLTVSNGGSVPTDGTWISNVPSNPAPTTATFAVYFPASFGTLTWSRTSSTANGWSPLAVDTAAPAISGYTACSSTFTPTSTYRWTYTTGNRRFTAAALPTWQVVRSNLVGTCPTTTIHVRRTVTWNGRTYETRRGPATLEPTTA